MERVERRVNKQGIHKANMSNIMMAYMDGDLNRATCPLQPVFSRETDTILRKLKFGPAISAARLASSPSFATSSTITTMVLASPVGLRQRRLSGATRTTHEGDLNSNGHVHARVRPDGVDGREETRGAGKPTEEVVWGKTPSGDGAWLGLVLPAWPAQLTTRNSRAPLPPPIL